MTIRVHFAGCCDADLADRLVTHDAVVCTASLLSCAPGLEDALDLLNSDERVRFAGYTNAVVARRYACGRRLLREALGVVLRRAPADVPLREGLHGKPYVAAGAGRPVYFSVSHSEELFVLAMSRHSDVGIDVERARAFEQWPRVADRVLDPQERRQLDLAVEAGEDPSEAFLRQWCRVEAELKAIGSGIIGLEAHRAGERPRGLRLADLSALPIPSDVSAVGGRYQCALALCTPGAPSLAQSRPDAAQAPSPTASPARASTA